MGISLLAHSVSTRLQQNNLVRHNFGDDAATIGIDIAAAETTHQCDFPFQC